MKKLALPALALALSACSVNTLPDATLSLSPSSITVEQGKSTQVSFKKYVYSGEPTSGYSLSARDTLLKGLKVEVSRLVLDATDSATLTVTAAQNAELGKQKLEVSVSGGMGTVYRVTLPLFSVPV